MSVTNFIPAIWSARLLAHLNKTHVYAALVNRDYEGEIKKMGDTVKINQLGRITIKDYEKGRDLDEPEELDGKQTTLVIDQGKYFNFSIEDVDQAQVNPKLMDGAMQESAYGMNDVTDMFLANLMAVNAANNGDLGDDTNPIVPTKNDAYDYLVDRPHGEKCSDDRPVGGSACMVPWSSVKGPAFCRKRYRLQ